MKALIICDDKSVTEKTKKIVEECGCDTIIYRHVIKALDNIEEISPNIVVISASDFPRHWKTFISYAETTRNEKIPTILFTPKGFSPEETKKANALGVIGMYSDTSISDTWKLKDVLLNLMPQKSRLPKNDFDTSKASAVLPANSSAGNKFGAEKNCQGAETSAMPSGSGLLSRGKYFAALQEKAVKTDKSEVEGIRDDGMEKVTAKTSSLIRELHANLEKSASPKMHDGNSMIFTNPYSGAFVTGSIKSISNDEKTINFAPDIKESIRRLATGDSILSISLKTTSGMRHVTGRIDKVDNDIMTLSVS